MATESGGITQHIGAYQIAIKKPASPAGGEKPIGEITHYYSKIGVGIIELKDVLKVGEKIKIKGHSTEFDQSVDSIQIDHKEVEEAKSGDVIGLKVNDKVREGDEVYKAE